MRRLTISSIFALCLLLTLAKREAFAQIYKLELTDPTKTACTGETFQVNLLINTAGAQTINGDALLSFDPALVKVESAQTGNFFTYFSSTSLSGVNNQYLVSSWEESIAHTKSSTTDTLFATLMLRAESGGNANLSFLCTTGSEADSNINRASDSEDIIDCNSVVPLAFPLCSGTQLPVEPASTATPIPTPTTAAQTGLPTSTPTPTLTPIPTSTPIPIPTSTPRPTSTPVPTLAQAPRAGSTEVTIGAIGIGAVLTVVGILFIL